MPDINNKLGETANLHPTAEEKVLAVTNVDATLTENSEVGTDQPEKDPIEQAAEILCTYIRDESGRSHVVGKKAMLLNPPQGLEKEQVSILLDDMQAFAVLANVSFVQGKKDTYYYDTNMMTGRYADLASLLEDKDILRTIAQVVRHESKVYPRPTRVLSLMGPPYRFTQDEVLGAVARMKFIEEYQDIDAVTASNGNICIYSSLHMSKRYAQALCEQIEVVQQQFQ